MRSTRVFFTIFKKTSAKINRMISLMYRTRSEMHLEKALHLKIGTGRPVEKSFADREKNIYTNIVEKSTHENQ